MYYNLAYKKIDNNVIIFPTSNDMYHHTIAFCKSFYDKISRTDERKLLLIDLKSNTDIIKENLTYHFILEKNARYILNHQFDVLYIIEQFFLEHKRRFNNNRLNVVFHLPKLLLADFKDDYQYLNRFKHHYTNNINPFIDEIFANVNIKINIIGEDHLIIGNKNNKYRYYIDFSNGNILINYFNTEKEN